MEIRRQPNNRAQPTGRDDGRVADVATHAPVQQNRVNGAQDDLGRPPQRQAAAGSIVNRGLAMAGVAVATAAVARGVHNLSLGKNLFDNLPEVPKQSLPSGTIMLWRPHPDDPPEWYAGDPTHHRDQKIIESGHGSLDFSFKGHEIGDVSTGHVALWTKDPGDKEAPEICEAGGEGVKCSPLPRGRWVAYKPASEALGQKASEIAQRWLNDGSLPYSHGAVLQVPLRVLAHPSGVFDTRADGEAAIREACQEDEKGHPNFAKTVRLAGAQGTFCSELVAYAYRCAAQELGAKTLIPLIPEHTSPLAMHNHMLKSRDFVPLGIVKEEDKTEAAKDTKSPAESNSLANVLTTHYGVNL